MPNFDGTGPAGKGPMTGGKRGVKKGKKVKLPRDGRGEGKGKGHKSGR